MDAEAKKTALRMIPYGIYLLTAVDGDDYAGAGVSWVSQGSFDPPLVVVSVKRDSHSFEVVQRAGAFALHVVGKDQGELANGFFRAVEREGDTLGGVPFAPGPATGAPILAGMPAHLECKVCEVVSAGDHAQVVAEVVDAQIAAAPEGRCDAVILTCGDISPKLYYGG